MLLPPTCHLNSLPDKAFSLSQASLPPCHSRTDFVSSKWRLEREESKQERGKNHRREEETTLNQGPDLAPLSM